MPSTTRSGTGASALPSMVKVTVPVGVPSPAVTTVAVNVTVSPTTDGSFDDDDRHRGRQRVVRPSRVSTVWVKGFDTVLAA